MTALSVLDLSPITTGHSGATALRNSLDLAQLADRLGYTRYWVAEHHNLPSVASSAPDIMIGQIAALTRRMRVGSGGVMLPNHAPLMVIETRGFPEGHPFRNVRAMPADVPLPPIYLLGSSGYSAELAAAIGAGFSFAHHFSTHDAVDAMTSYRAHFKPSPALSRPHAILAVAAVAADTDEEAERLAATIDLNFVRRQKGEYLPLASPEEALAYD